MWYKLKRIMMRPNGVEKQVRPSGWQPWANTLCYYNINSNDTITTIYDLSFTNIDTFINLSKNCGIQIQYAQSLYNMFKEFSTLLLKKKEYQSNIKYILQKLFMQQKLLWDKIIIQKSNELTSFYKVQFV